MTSLFLATAVLSSAQAVAGDALSAKETVSAKKETQHWAFVPPKSPALPTVKYKSWGRTPVDAFVLARLEQEGMKPSPEADRATLIRRLYLDLLGLPPTPAQVEAFVRDRRAEAYEQLVEELLASPHFGERWGRHWLDLARYADSAGYQIDKVRPGAYLYRDWVVQAYNEDKPYDQFVIEQLAGDLLPEATPDTRLATGLHRMTLENFEDGVDRAEFVAKAKVDRVSTTGTAFLGLTLGCAECHTHKYDPITQREFYQIYAFFNQAVEVDTAVSDDTEKVKYDQRLALWDAENKRLRAAQDDYTRTELRDRQMAWEKTANPASLANEGAAEALKIPATKRTAKQRAALVTYFRDRDAGWLKLNEEVRRHAKKRPKFAEAKALTFSASTNPPPTFVHVRGDFLQHGDPVEPGVLRVLNEFKPRAASADRLDFARWIAAPQNPLTARVAVNHVWQHLFGRGLVTTPEDFGTRSELPSHPALLDWLAVKFSAPTSADGLGWSRKGLIRLLVTSATYRQSAQITPALNERDPQNVLLARQGRWRVEAEAVRDLHLAVSGLLNPAIGGPAIRPKMPEDLHFLGYIDRGVAWENSAAPDAYRRGLYVQVMRTIPYPVPMIFDGVNASESCARREQSSTPLQPLTLQNNPAFVDCAKAFAKRIVSEGGASPKQRTEFAFRVAMGRAPQRSELARLAKFYQVALAKSSLDAATLALAQVVFNLDEFLTRE